LPSQAAVHIFTQPPQQEGMKMHLTSRFWSTYRRLAEVSLMLTVAIQVYHVGLMMQVGAELS
jgi:hypothetical protein